jgi:DNA mismatch repair ATPase MutS
MYPDRDFDPDSLLSRKEVARYPKSNEEAANFWQLLPRNSEALTQDLGLNVVWKAMAGDDHFMIDASKLALLSSLTDLDTIRYRQKILADCLTNEKLARRMYQIAAETIERERKNYLGFFSRYPAGILSRSVDVLRMFVTSLKQLRIIADENAARFTSEGFSNLFTMLKTELSDEYLERVDRHLSQLKFHKGVLISAELGKGNKGANIVLRKQNDEHRSWLEQLFATSPPAYTFRLHPRDESGARALSELRDRGINLVANALAQSADHVLSFFQCLRAELAFYIGCINLRGRLANLGEPICLPGIAPPGCRRLEFSGLYDASLALSSGKKVVGNDLAADGKQLFVITGANTGGKSTFLRSIGLAQLMTQAGMFAPAETFSAEAVEAVFTHYKREEDAGMESGKWDEELGRMSGIVDRMKPNALLLLNESFASTNDREGSEIARQIVGALEEKQVKVFFVTHLYDFANRAFELKSEGAIFLRAERRPDGTRPFKLITGAPLQTSYGEDLYQAIFAGGQPRSFQGAEAGARPSVNVR